MLSTQPWRSILLVKWMGLFDTECLLYADRHYAMDIAEAIRSGHDMLKLTIPGRKKSRNIRPFYTMIGGDALTSLREYFERDERGWPKHGEPIWYYPHYRRPITRYGLTAYWLRLLRRANFISTKFGSIEAGVRYGFNLHNTRDIAISILATVPNLNPLCAQFWCGHDIDKLRYNEFYKERPDYVEDQYRLAMPTLNIISNPTGETERGHELTDLKTKYAALEKKLDHLTLSLSIARGEATVPRVQPAPEET